MSDSAGPDEIPAEGPMTRAVRRSLDDLAPTERVPKHAALALLALQYAAALDADQGLLIEVGPKLQSALVALGCAPSKSVQPAPTGGGETNGDGRATLTLLRNTWGGDRTG